MRPRYVGCSHCWQITRECWRNNHVPYAGLVYARVGTLRETWEIIFSRYLRRKKFLWPEEAKKFTNLYKEKHPELSRGGARNRMEEAAYNGAVWNELLGTIAPAFGVGGFLEGKPYTPPENKKEAEFLRLSMAKIMQLSRERNEEKRKYFC